VRVFRTCCCDCVACREDQFRCHNTGRCIPSSSECDRFDDCGDWSDENCSQYYDYFMFFDILFFCYVNDSTIS